MLRLCSAKDQRQSVYVIRWTVRKKPTGLGVDEGRDEMLEKVLALIAARASSPSPPRWGRVQTLRGALAVPLALGGLSCSEPARSDLSQPLSVAEWSGGVDTLPGTYTRVMSPAEFHDSLLVVPDVADGTLWRLNTLRGSRVAFASKGNGPGEYQRPGWAVRLHADSVALLWGSSEHPFPVLSVETGVGHTHTLPKLAPADQQSAVFAPVAAPFLRLADTLGHVYGASTMRISRSGLAPPQVASLDTQPVVRFSTRAAVVDTVLLNPIGTPVVPTGRDADGAMTFGMSMGPYAPSND